jgi:hypothetical protein
MMPPTKERSSASYEREIASLTKALSDECKNSYRLSQENVELRRTVDCLLPASGCRTVKEAVVAFGSPE